MLTSDRLSINISECREKLNAFASLPADKFDAEKREECDKVSKELATYERQFRAAKESESAIDEKPEVREARAIEDGLSLRAYMESARTGNPLEGREKEWNAEHNLASNAVPFEAIVPEQRADVVSPGLSTNVPNTQHSIVERVFARSATAFLGVTMPTVGVGEQSYACITGGTTAEMKAADAVKESTAWSLSVKSVKPTRLQARYTFRREDIHTTAGLEQALRNDLSRVMSDALDKQVLTGNGQSPNVKSFLATQANGGLKTAAAPFVTSSEVTYESWAELMAACVDGIWASSMKDLRVLVGPATYTKLAGELQMNTADSAMTFTNREVGGFRTSANMPAVASHKQLGIVVRGNRTGEFQAPIWQGLTLIRDEVSDATAAHIHITAVMLWNFVRIRDDSAIKINPTISS